MGVPTPTKMVERFAENATVGNVPGGKTVPFPVASQIPGGNPGRASLNDGYTPANMTPLVSGGTPMSGPDTNGALFLISGPVVSFSAGNLRFTFDSVYAAAIGGYDKGAQVQDATDATLVWTSAVAANSTDPASGGGPAVWIASRPLYSTSAPTAGTHSDNTLPGPSDYFLDVNTAAGAITLDSFVSQRDGQRLYISATGANNLTVGGRTSGTAANNVRASAAVTVVQNDTLAIQYNNTISRWIFV